MSTSNILPLTPREAAIDALIRFVTSLDTGSPNLLSSSITQDISLDVSGFSKVGIATSTEPITGHSNVVERLMSAVGKTLDTTHCATNIRCTVYKNANGEADTADITSVVLAQHFRLGEGVKMDCQEYYLNGNMYEGKVVKDRDGEEDAWKIQKLKIWPAWVVGNPEVMKV